MMKKNLKLSDRLNSMCRTMFGGTLLLAFIFLAYAFYFSASEGNKHMERFDSVLRGRTESAAELAFSSMESLKDAVNSEAGGADAVRSLLLEFASSKGFESAVVTQDGTVVAATEGYPSEYIDVMTVSPRKRFTVKQFPASVDGRALSVFMPLEKKGGFLAVLWRPSIVGSKIVSWLGNSVYAPDGRLLDTNIAGEVLARESPSIFDGGKVTTERGSGVSSRLVVPDPDFSPWFVTISENKSLLAESLFRIIPIVIVVLVVLAGLFFLFVRTRSTVVDDIEFLKSVVSRADLSVDGNPFSGLNLGIFMDKKDWRNRSLEVRQLGKLLHYLSERVNDNMARLGQRAGFDALTGMPNRSTMVSNLQARIDGEEMFSILFMDLDGFKPINDNLGHETGDLVLQEVARALGGNMFRSGDFVCRWGGDEFVVCLKGDVEGVIPKLLERIRGKMAEIDVNGLAGKDDLSMIYKVGVSVGTACFPMDGSDVETLVHKADERMYEDKMTRKVAR